MTRRQGLRVLAGVAAVIVAGLIAWLAERNRAVDPIALEAAMAGAKAMPLVGRVIEDDPGAADRLRAALEEELRNPTTEGPSRPLKVMAALRAERLIPALQAAGDGEIAAALAARLALVKYLSTADLALCREFAVSGLQRGDRLDETGQRLLRTLLEALETAYRSGKDRPKGTPVISGEQARALLTKAGLSATDLAALGQLGRLDSRQACDLAVRLNEAPGRLTGSEGADLNRYLVTAQ